MSSSSFVEGNVETVPESSIEAENDGASISVGTVGDLANTEKPQNLEMRENADVNEECRRAMAQLSVASKSSPSVPTASKATGQSTGAEGGVDASNSRSNEAQEGEDVEIADRKVIAVSASKGSLSYFNLARKFLVHDELVDFSALENAIVIAIDTAQFLERSQLATIISIQTSFITVEPRPSKKSQLPPMPPPMKEKTNHQSPEKEQKPTKRQSPKSISSSTVMDEVSGPNVSSTSTTGASKTGKHLRRSRMVITVKRTENFRKWLEENSPDFQTPSLPSTDPSNTPNNTPDASTAAAATSPTISTTTSAQDALEIFPGPEF